MHRALIFATAAAIAVPAWAAETPAGEPAAQPTPISDSQQRDAAIREIQELKARINRLEATLGVSSTTPAIQYTPAAPKGPKDHNLELYGFLQLDAIQDFNRVNPDWDATLRPSRIPTVDGQFGGDGQSIFRNIHEKNVASLRRTNHCTTQYLENSGRRPLKQALVFFDHPRAKFRGRFHIFGKRDQIPRELLGIDVRLPGAVFQQEIDGVPESLRREHGTAML